MLDVLTVAGFPSLPCKLRGLPTNAAEIDLLETHWRQVSGCPDPPAAFGGLVEQGLIRAAACLRDLPPSFIRDLATAGIALCWVLIELLARTADPEVYLLLPAQFVGACGAAGLPIYFGGSV
jgi:hypothetical protein